MSDKKSDISITSAFTEVKVCSLKESFISLQNEFTGKMISKATLEDLNHRYKVLFYRFGLENLQWRLSCDMNTVTFTPIRAIDQYAIQGILLGE